MTKGSITGGAELRYGFLVFFVSKLTKESAGKRPIVQATYLRRALGTLEDDRAPFPTVCTTSVIPQSLSFRIAETVYLSSQFINRGCPSICGYFLQSFCVIPCTSRLKSALIHWHQGKARTNPERRSVESDLLLLSSAQIFSQFNLFQRSCTVAIYRSCRPGFRLTQA